MADFSTARLGNAHLQFFARANPGFVRGEGLACLAEIRASNLTAAAKRMIGGHGVENTRAKLSPGQRPPRRIFRCGISLPLASNQSRDPRLLIGFQDNGVRSAKRTFFLGAWPGKL